MENDAIFEDMSYAQLRCLAKHYGVKANLKADTLRKELKRASMAGVGGDDDDEDSSAEDDGPLAARDDEEERSIHFAGLPSKTPANVTRRKGSRMRYSAAASSSGRDDTGAVGKLGVADRTIADPLAEDRIDEEEEEEVEEGFLSEDEKETTTERERIDDASAYMSEDGEENSSEFRLDDETRKSTNDYAASTTHDGGTVDDDDQLRLERQRTFEMDSPSTDLRPPLARQRTFEMESPTLDSPRPPLARQRTFELDSASSSSSFAAVVSGATPVDDARATSTSDEVAPPASTDAPIAEFSILQDETSELSADELKARIMASIAVTPSALAAEQALTGDASSTAGAASVPNENQGKSCSKDWKKIHSTNENRMESLVDFYQRKRKRADEAHKSAQKSAQMSAAKRAAAAATFGGASAPTKSARSLAFPAPTTATAQSKIGVVSKAVASKSATTSKIAGPSKSTTPPKPASRAVERAGAAPSIQAPVAIRTGETTALPRKEVPNAFERGRLASSSSAKDTGLSREEAPNAKRARRATSTSNAAPSGNVAAAKSKVHSVTPKRAPPTSESVEKIARPKTKSGAPGAPSGSSFIFEPTVFSTKDMNLNFGAAHSKLKPPAVYPIMKNAAGGGGAGAKTSALKAGGSTVAKSASDGASLLPSLPKRRVSPRSGKSVTSDASATSSTRSTPCSDAKTIPTPLPRLAPSRTTTPGKRSAAGTPASTSSKRQATPKITPQNGIPPARKSPWIPAGIAEPNFNFSANVGDAENVFKFTAVGASTSAQQHQPARKKFDLKESLKQKLKYKPHRGPLRKFEDDKVKDGDLKKRKFR